MRRKTKDRRLSTGSVMLVAALVVACAVAAAAAAAGSKPSREGQARRAAAGSVLTIASSDAATTLNPAQNGNSAASAIYDELAYEPLMNLTNNGTITPGLATSWGYVGDGNTKFEMTLRTNARFSDGTPVTADAVAASINYWRGAKGPLAAYTSAISSVTAIGPSTVQVQCSTADPDLPLVFSRLLMAGDVISPAGLKNPTALQNQTFGAGPYMLDPSQTVAGSSYTYVPNPYFYNQSAIHWQKVVVKVIADDNSALAALKTGQVNIALVGSNTAAAAGSGLSVYTAPAQFEGLYLVNRGPGSPLAKVKVRQALNYAVDRTAIAKALFGKYATASDEVAVPGYDGWDPKYANHYTYDPAKAKALLAAAGYPHGFTLNVDSLNEFQMNNMAEAISGYLAKIGVKLSITVTPTIAAYVNDALSKKYQTVSMYYGGLPMFVIGQQLLAENAGLFNPFKSDNQTFDKLLAKGASLPAAERNVVWRQLQDTIVDQGWQLPVLYDDETWVTTKNLRGFTVGGGNINPDPLTIAPAS